MSHNPENTSFLENLKTIYWWGKQKPPQSFLVTALCNSGMMVGDTIKEMNSYTLKRNKNTLD